jgi:hypothetical protein
MNVEHLTINSLNAFYENVNHGPVKSIPVPECQEHSPSPRELWENAHGVDIKCADGSKLKKKPVKDSHPLDKIAKNRPKRPYGPIITVVNDRHAGDVDLEHDIYG